ncbi:YraN family protein [Rhodococcus rhodnii]|uniref:UPF0102 protein Rrhod_2637 n=2 Tax=Rhodococcus rhodnii TaxID=38312 RepID=R7WPQ8_9NOCA|nr:YraN family protein [Rhodococcus rhodnii]EOM75989.1 hypothetical protein Rrhod_2637 [Rhodococcus rhodnii LMG 5362]TXG90830.1 YraN family protein [Rhodococcus rhodnii]
MNARTELGSHGEELAARYLVESGMEILDRNWRTRAGELDLIAADSECAVFVEVKTRTGLGYGTPAEAVTPLKQRRIRALGVAWLRTSERSWASVRFDVVSVLVRRGYAPRIDHVKGAF